MIPGPKTETPQNIASYLQELGKAAAILSQAHQDLSMLRDDGFRIRPADAEQVATALCQIERQASDTVLVLNDIWDGTEETPQERCRHCIRLIYPRGSQWVHYFNTSRWCRGQFNSGTQAEPA